MTDDALKDLYESVLGIRLLPHQLQILKQLRQDEARNRMDRTNVYKLDESNDYMHRQHVSEVILK